MIVACIIIGVGLFVWWMINNPPDKLANAPSNTPDLYTNKKTPLEQAVDYWFPDLVYDIEIFDNKGEPIRYVAFTYGATFGRGRLIEKTEYPPVVHWKVKTRPGESFAYCSCPTLVEHPGGFIEVSYEGELETILEIMQCTTEGQSTDEINKKYGHRGVRRKRV